MSGKVVPDRQAKSISHETTFAQDIDDLETLRSWLMLLTEQVASRLRRCQLRGRTVQLKVRYHDFHTITRSQSLPQATNVTDELWQTAQTILESRLPARRLSVRLIGVGVTNFDTTAVQQTLAFENIDVKDPHRGEALDQVTDEIADRFGTDAIRRALTSGRKQASDKHSGS